jgi:cellulose synthase/poly-beta-1,6-N-acetylglucosamine synthase-like glycosyltransferase
MTSPMTDPDRAAAADSRCSVVVTTHTSEREHLLRRCLEALASGREQPSETIVVVDRDADLARHLRLTLPAGVDVELSSRGGVASARNAGLAVAVCPIVGFLDDDVTPGAGWLGAVRGGFEADPDVVAVASRVLPDYAAGARRLPGELLWLVGCTYEGHRADAGPVSRPIGSAMAFRREALLAVGGFPAEFGPAHTRRRSSNEELAVSEALRGRFGAGCIRFEPEAEVCHAVPAARTTFRYLVERSWVEGTSKAEIRERFGPASLGDDRRYVVSTLGPRVLAGLRNRNRQQAADSAWLAASFLTTATGFAARRLSHVKVRRP